MTRVRFLGHAPPYMPGDITLFDDEIAQALEAKGVAEIVKEPVGASRANMKDGGEAARPAKDKP